MANKRLDAKKASAELLGITPPKKEKPVEKPKEPEIPQMAQRPPRVWEKSTTPGKKVRYNLVLDEDLNNFMRGIVWERRLNMSAYINGLIRADMEAYEKECKKKGIEPYEGWE